MRQFGAHVYIGSRYNNALCKYMHDKPRQINDIDVYTLVTVYR